jgi:hypothetical protein
VDVDCEENDSHNNANGSDGSEEGIHLEVDFGVLDKGQGPVLWRSPTQPPNRLPSAQIQLLRHSIKFPYFHLFPICNNFQSQICFSEQKIIKLTLKLLEQNTSFSFVVVKPDWTLLKKKFKH